MRRVWDGQSPKLQQSHQSGSCSFPFGRCHWPSAGTCPVSSYWLHCSTGVCGSLWSTVLPAWWCLASIGWHLVVAPTTQDMTASPCVTCRLHHCLFYIELAESFHFMCVIGLTHITYHKKKSPYWVTEVATLFSYWQRFGFVTWLRKS